MSAALEELRAVRAWPFALRVEAYRWASEMAVGMAAVQSGRRLARRMLLCSLVSRLERQCGGSRP